MRRLMVATSELAGLARPKDSVDSRDVVLQHAGCVLLIVSS